MRGPSWSRRRVLLATVVLATVLVTAVTAVRVADVHAEPDWPDLDTDQDPAALVGAVQDHLHRIDHRTVTRVSIVDAETDTREPLLVFEDAHDYSNAQYVANYWSTRPAPDEDSPERGTYRAAWTQHHTFLALLSPTLLDATESRVLFYGDDRQGVLLVGGTASTPAVGDYRLENWTKRGSPRRVAGIGLSYDAFFLDHGADWEVVDRTDDAVTLRVDESNDVLAARPLWRVKRLHNGSRVTVVLDEATGEPRRVTERRVVTLDVEGTDGDEIRRTFTFLVETEFTDVGDVDVTPPAGTRPLDLYDLLRDFLEY